MSAPSLSATERPRLLDRLDREVFDCVVIGGGITGAGIAREATLRGLSVALLEADDFAAGTSSRSSKLIHGGLRYLALGDVATVRATALERTVIHRLAPHLAEPQWMIVPTRSWAGAMKMRAAITTYEKLGSVEGRDVHRTVSEDELAREEPLLDRTRFRHAVVYREYVTDDARLVLANLRAAAGEGAVVLSRLRVRELLLDGARAAGVGAQCSETGRTVRVRARCVINAAGPFVDDVRALEDRAATPLLHLSKGVHVVLPIERLPLRHVVILDAADRRSLFAVPRGRTIYVGTTDTSFVPRPGSEDALWPPVTRDDVAYLLEPIARTFSVPEVAPEEVIGAFAGLRPLIAQPGRPPAEISRRDETGIGRAGVVTIAGGKLTGYRPMARATLERAAEHAGLRIRSAPEQDPVLPGGAFDGDLASLARGLARESGLSMRAAERLVRLHGSEAVDVVRAGAEPLAPGLDLIGGEIDRAVFHEGALHLEDVVYRRTRAAWFEPGTREHALVPAAARMSALLGWDAARRSAEIAHTAARLDAELAFRTTPHPTGGESA